MVGSKILCLNPIVFNFRVNSANQAIGLLGSPCAIRTCALCLKKGVLDHSVLGIYNV